MINKLQRGFTLIELLVVIAIIGILAAVVLASLNDARDSATNASVKQTTNNIRSQAEIFYNSLVPNSYTGVCTSADVATLMTAVDTASTQITGLNTTLATAGSATTITCHADAAGAAYAASAALIDTGSGQTYYCVDSTGYAGVTAAALPASDTTCL
ncbi:MAG: type II secretion system protein [Patescibacteria group bacterium]